MKWFVFVKRYNVQVIPCSLSVTQFTLFLHTGVLISKYPTLFQVVTLP